MSDLGKFWLEQDPLTTKSETDLRAEIRWLRHTRDHLIKSADIEQSLFVEACRTRGITSCPDRQGYTGPPTIDDVWVVFDRMKTEIECLQETILDHDCPSFGMCPKHCKDRTQDGCPYCEIERLKAEVADRPLKGLVEVEPGVLRGQMLAVRNTTKDEPTETK